MTSLPDKSSAASFGALGKVNYQQLPPADQNTDWDNTLLAPAICDVAALGLVSPRACLSFTLGASDGALTLHNWSAVWANVTSTPPVLHHVSTGIFTITFPTVVSDEYSASFGNVNTHTVNLTKGWGNLENPGGLHSVSVSASANVVTIKLFDNTNALNDFVGVTATIWGAY